ncbi:hypothetical protein [Paenibacillus alvei]|uniref:hypothetical protein n=1 Tax=Paenibacillus alvei TaxID=44250 RepID=UPI000287C139|nr:hypothetical protein [Paenibacillus alvei]EJW15134.1 hypothetical protein PAV_9c00560 [Paenibacillus alvei DSM 29]MEC0083784.1 hypothetical protein [Paenibacillus alvei]
MKKVDWLIAAFFVTIGLVCLTVSAMYYQGDTFISRMDYFKLKTCLGIVVLGFLIYLICRILRLKKHKRNRK